MNIEIRTLNINELYALMRELGVSTSQTKLGDAIEQGKYPFAICVQQKNRNFEIYEKKLREWIIERADSDETDAAKIEARIIEMIKNLRDDSWGRCAS